MLPEKFHFEAGIGEVFEYVWNNASRKDVILMVSFAFIALLIVIAIPLVMKSCGTLIGNVCTYYKNCWEKRRIIFVVCIFFLCSLDLMKNPWKVSIVMVGLSVFVIRNRKLWVKLEDQWDAVKHSVLLSVLCPYLAINIPMITHMESKGVLELYQAFYIHICWFGILFAVLVLYDFFEGVARKYTIIHTYQSKKRKERDKSKPEMEETISEDELNLGSSSSECPYVEGKKIIFKEEKCVTGRFFQSTINLEDMVFYRDCENGRHFRIIVKNNSFDVYCDVGCKNCNHKNLPTTYLRIWYLELLVQHKLKESEPLKAVELNKDEIAKAKKFEMIEKREKSLIEKMKDTKWENAFSFAKNENAKRKPQVKIVKLPIEPVFMKFKDPEMFKEKKLLYSKNLERWNDLMKKGEINYERGTWIGFWLNEKMEDQKIIGKSLEYIEFRTPDTAFITRIGCSEFEQIEFTNYVECRFDYKNTKMYVLECDLNLRIPLGKNGIFDEEFEVILKRKKAIFDTGSSVHSIDLTHIINANECKLFENKGLKFGDACYGLITVNNSHGNERQWLIKMRIEDSSRVIGATPYRILLGSGLPFREIDFFGSNGKIVLFEKNEDYCISKRSGELSLNVKLF